MTARTVLRRNRSAPASLTVAVLALAASPLAGASIPPAPPLEPVAAEVAAPDCESISLPVFFSRGESTLSAPARAALDRAVSAASGCAVEAVSLAARGRDGADAGAAFALREARAQAVLAALPEPLAQQAQRRAPAVMAPTLSDLTLPDERAVMVTLRLAPARES